MTRHGFLGATLFTLSLTGVTLTHVGFASPHAPEAPPAVYNSVKTADSTSSAIYHWRDCQPHHWHEFVVQH
jgi:hypothetical protein